MTYPNIFAPQQPDIFGQASQAQPNIFAQSQPNIFAQPAVPDIFAGQRQVNIFGNVQPDIFANAVVVSFSADLDEDCWIDDYESYGSHEDSDLEYIQDEINALSELIDENELSEEDRLLIKNMLISAALAV